MLIMVMTMNLMKKVADVVVDLEISVNFGIKNLNMKGKSLFHTFTSNQYQNPAQLIHVLNLRISDFL